MKFLELKAFILYKAQLRYSFVQKNKLIIYS